MTASSRIQRLSSRRVDCGIRLGFVRRMLGESLLFWFRTQTDLEQWHVVVVYQGSGLCVCCQ
jgi:hypothetical protein